MIIKRGNRYGVRIYVATRQVWVGSFRTRQEARQAEREALMRVRPTNDETVSEFVERWLRDFKRPRASTNRHNAYMVKPLNFHDFIDAVKQIGAFWAVLNEPPPGSPARFKGQ